MCGLLTKYQILLYFVMALLTFSAQGCQKRVYLMPTPAMWATGELNPFSINPKLEEGSRVDVFFATNRSPRGDSENRTYSIFPGTKLRVGTIHFTIGGKEMEWEKLLRLSISEDKERPALHIEELEEMAAVPLDDEAYPLPAGFKSFSDSINDLLARSIDKDIMVYVHGANSSVYRAGAQAAQFRHFTGRNSVVLVFLWPSAENLLQYGKDVRHAKKSAAAFKRLITFLSDYTTAENINILAYSAGAQITSPGLAILGRKTEKEKRQRLRIGEVYYAAADEGVDSFVKNLKTYIDIPRNVTFTVNIKDRVLAIAESYHKISRIGRPRKEDFDPDDASWVRRASNEYNLDIIGVGEETVPGMPSKSHDFWYTHPWISSDVLVQFVYHANARKRGLVQNHTEKGLEYWTFPPDYVTRLTKQILEADQEKK